MDTHEIPRNEWSSFLDSFSRRHEGWLSTLELTPADDARGVEARNKPLVGVTAEQKDNEPLSIWIVLGERTGDHVAHRIVDPQRVALRRNDEGHDQGLDIGATGGASARIRFRAPAAPETLDGVVASG